MAQESRSLLLELVRKEFGEGNDGSGSVARSSLKPQDFSVMLPPMHNQGFEHAHRMNDLGVAKSGLRTIGSRRTRLRGFEQRLSGHNLIEHRQAERHDPANDRDVAKPWV